MLPRSRRAQVEAWAYLRHVLDLLTVEMIAIDSSHHQDAVVTTTC